MALGQLAKQARLARGVTLSALARSAGIHKSTLSRWESGRTLPNAPELLQVMDALALSPSDRTLWLQSLAAPRAIRLSRADDSISLYPVGLGELIRALRVRAGRTQAEVARAAGVTQSLVSQWEACDARPDVGVLHEVCLALGASPDEIESLTSGIWQNANPLSTDVDELRDVSLYLEFRDPSPDRRLAYLALAARFGELFRRGKVSEAEAQSVWGTYGHYLRWRFQRRRESWDTIQPALQTIARSRGRLTMGQQEALSASISIVTESGHSPGVDSLMTLMKRIRKRLPQDRLSWWFQHQALLAEAAENRKAVTSYFLASMEWANSEMEAGTRLLSFCESLIRQRRFREAQEQLRPIPNSETRSIFHAANDLAHAKVYASLGEKAEARRWLSTLREKTQCNGLNHLNEHAREVERLLEG